MNKVELLGRLTKDVELRYSQGAQTMAIARFTVAINRRVAADRQQTADFIGCIAFGKTAENIDKYFHKGNQIAVVGRIQTGSYTNKDNQKVYTTDVVVDEFDFVDPKGTVQPQEPHEQAVQAVSQWVGIPDSVDDDSLPFN